MYLCKKSISPWLLAMLLRSLHIASCYGDSKWLLKKSLKSIHERVLEFVIQNGSDRKHRSECTSEYLILSQKTAFPTDLEEVTAKRSRSLQIRPRVHACITSTLFLAFDLEDLMAYWVACITSIPFLAFDLEDLMAHRFACFLPASLLSFRRTCARMTLYVPYELFAKRSLSSTTADTSGCKKICDHFVCANSLERFHTCERFPLICHFDSARFLVSDSTSPLLSEAHVQFFRADHAAFHAARASLLRARTRIRLRTHTHAVWPYAQGRSP